MTKIESKHNSSGELFKIPLEHTTVLNIFTKAGKYRGGKVYSEEKFFTIISGSVEVTVNIGDKDMTNTYTPGLIFNIPANIPNLFYFPEDSEMLEWFKLDAHIDVFEPYIPLKKLPHNLIVPQYIIGLFLSLMISLVSMLFITHGHISHFLGLLLIFILLNITSIFFYRSLNIKNEILKILFSVFNQSVFIFIGTYLLKIIVPYFSIPY